jgi:hypothetical protein
MGMFYDELVFDDREKEDLFAGTRYKNPFYADILKRWEYGFRLTVDEERTVTGILIFHPELMLNCCRKEEIIELIRSSLQQPDMQDPLNPEKGLFLYTLLFLLLIHGKKEESIEVTDNIEKFLIYFCKNYNTNFNGRKTVSGSDTSGNCLDSIYSILPADLEKAYTEIISLIMERNELLSLKPGFNVSQLPVIPDKKLSPFAGNDLRGEALEFYYKQEYDKASVIYHKMLVNKFEQPGTLVHLARLEIMQGNVAQAEIYIVNAWRMRHEAPFYVQSRILFFVVLFKMLRSEQFEEWLGCMKEVLNQPDSKMQWDMDRLLSKVEQDLNPWYILFLRALLKTNSGTDDEALLNQYEPWAKATPVNFESWPDFEIASRLV